ncbi:hypothetical protein V5O48_011692, partial [Marasmius crinis-equi]
HPPLNTTIPGITTCTQAMASLRQHQSVKTSVFHLVFKSRRHFIVSPQATTQKSRKSFGSPTQIIKNSYNSSRPCLKTPRTLNRSYKTAGFLKMLLFGCAEEWQNKSDCGP